MAIAVMNWVWQHSRTKNGARLVLLAIADCCNSDDGTGAWPTIPELMAKTNLSERAVQLGLKEAESAGELKIERGAMGNNRHRFAVIMSPADSAGLEAQNLRPAKSAPPQNLHHSPADSAASPAESAPGTISNHQENQDSPPTGESPRARANTRSRRAESTSSKTTKRGTRIPEDFAAKVTSEMVAWARKKCPDVDGRDQTERFVDYWSDKTGKDATKVDWIGTWRNWMRREQDKINDRKAKARTPPGSPGGGTPRSTTDERVAQVQALKAEYRVHVPGTDADADADEQQQYPQNTIPGVVVA